MKPHQIWGMQIGKYAVAFSVFYLGNIIIYLQIVSEFKEKINR